MEHWSKGVTRLVKAFQHKDKKKLKSGWKALSKASHTSVNDLCESEREGLLTAMVESEWVEGVERLHSSRLPFPFTALCSPRGDTILHLACKAALNDLNRDLVTPLVRMIPELLTCTNKCGVSAIQLVDHVESLNQSQPSTNTTEERWDSKLRDEEDFEHSESTGKFEDGWSHETQTPAESFDDWASRIASEYKSKKRKEGAKAYAAFQKRSRKNENLAGGPHPKPPPSLKLLKTAAASTLDSVCMKYQMKFTIFEKSSKIVSMKEVPFPGFEKQELDERVLRRLVEMQPDEEKKLKLLKRERFRWHPDKFRQKYSDRIEPLCKDKVFERVTLISQTINELKNSCT